MRTKITSAAAGLLLVLTWTASAYAQAPETTRASSDEAKRVREAAQAFQSVMHAPDNAIPQAILDKAEGIAVFPNVLKLAMGFGGERGKGVISVRNRETNTWSAPAFLTLTGGSWGAQIGGESADIILVVMNRRGLESLMNSEFKLGGEAEAAAGPVGRRAAASTDAAMHAQILSYSRARGLFAGVSLSGASVHEDMDSNEAFYGNRLHTREITLEGATKTAPQVVAVWRNTLDKYFMSDRAATSGRKDEK
jgi:SH3 domain-containing YSC84-like protein 1